MQKYNSFYYKNTWSNILNKYQVTSSILDLGDISRAHTLNKLLINYLVPQSNNRDIIIYDFGPGNWLYLDVLLNLKRYFSKMRITGADFSKEAMTFGLQKYSHLITQNITVNIKDGDIKEQLKSMKPFSVDCIICLETLEHLYDDEQVTREFDRILKPKGFLIISIPNKNLFPLSSAWIKYRINKNQLIEKDLIVGHLRRYQPKDILSIATNSNLKMINIIQYGFLLSEYMKLILTYAQKHFSFLLKMIFIICKKILYIENEVFNFLKVESSEGFFVLFQKK